MKNKVNFPYVFHLWNRVKRSQCILIKGAGGEIDKILKIYTLKVYGLTF